MPYISREERKRLDPIIEQLLRMLGESGPERLDGQLNYVVSKLLLGLYPPRYYNYNRAMGVLACISHEFYRRFVASYEDEKIRENGDIV